MPARPARTVGIAGLKCSVIFFGNSRENPEHVWSHFLRPAINYFPDNLKINHSFPGFREFPCPVCRFLLVTLLIPAVHFTADPCKFSFKRLKPLRNVFCFPRMTREAGPWLTRWSSLDRALADFYPLALGCQSEVHHESDIVRKDDYLTLLGKCREPCRYVSSADMIQGANGIIKDYGRLRDLQVCFCEKTGHSKSCLLTFAQNLRELRLLDRTHEGRLMLKCPLPSADVLKGYTL